MNNEEKLFSIKTILGNFVFINEENKSKEIQGKNVLSFTKFVLGVFCPGGFWLEGFLSGVLSGGLCPGGCPDTVFHTPNHYNHETHLCTYRVGLYKPINGLGSITPCVGLSRFRFRKHSFHILIGRILQNEMCTRIPNRKLIFSTWKHCLYYPFSAKGNISSQKIFEKLCRQTKNLVLYLYLIDNKDLISKIFSAAKLRFIDYS